MRYLGNTYLSIRPFAIGFNEGGPWFNFHISKSFGEWFLYVFFFGFRWSNDSYHSGPYGRW
jgi:hypothetical protein